MRNFEPAQTGLESSGSPLLIFIIAALGILAIVGIHRTKKPLTIDPLFYMAYSVAGFIVFDMFIHSYLALVLGFVTLLGLDRWNRYGFRNVSMMIFTAGAGAVLGTGLTIWGAAIFLIMFAVFDIWSSREELMQDAAQESEVNPLFPSFKVGNVTLAGGDIIAPMAFVVAGVNYGILPAVIGAVGATLGLVTLLHVNRRYFVPAAGFIGLFAVLGFALGTVI
jgi:presenilin-like A22 family membrane protease